MPSISKKSFVHPTAVIIGNVHISDNCGVFPHAVLRGDQNSIHIQEGSNIQDGCVIHVDEDNPAVIGKNVSIGHLAMVHGATIEENCIIGIHATVLNGAVIKKGSIIGANALVKEGMTVPEHSLVLGIPGKVVKTNVMYEERTRKNAEIYQNLTASYLKGRFQESKIKK